METLHLQSVSIKFTLLRFKVSFGTSPPQEALKVGIAHFYTNENEVMVEYLSV